MSGFLGALGRLLGLHGTPDGAMAGPDPQELVAVVGDIHGRADLLAELLAKIENEAPDARLVFVGDYVDRGPDSRAVIDMLRARGSGSVCLKGNHEVMLLEFLADPMNRGVRWLRHGGIETLESYGISLSMESSAAQIEAGSREFRAYLANGAENWLRSLPVMWQSGNLLVTHAGPDPLRPVSEQEEKVFLWGHNRFLRERRRDGLWVAHGHWARERAKMADGRIAVDTGAWQSGRLSAALISPDGRVRFVEARKAH